MIAYFDTSALVKLIVAEDGTDQAQRIWSEAWSRVSSLLLYPEARAALAKAQREARLDAVGLRSAVAAFETLWARIDRVAVTPALVVRAGVLAETEAMRGYDAVHLASAEAIADDETVVVAADRALCAAAARLGMAVVRLSP